MLEKQEMDRVMRNEGLQIYLCIALKSTIL